MILSIILIILTAYVLIALFYFFSLVKELNSQKGTFSTDEEDTLKGQLFLLFLCVLISWPSVAFSKITQEYDEK